VAKKYKKKNKGRRSFGGKDSAGGGKGELGMKDTPDRVNTLFSSFGIKRVGITGGLREGDKLKRGVERQKQASFERGKAEGQNAKNAECRRGMAVGKGEKYPIRAKQNPREGMPP